jgi:hypothetical protein
MIIVSLIALVPLGMLLATLVWLSVVLLRRQDHTREGFAFAASASITSMAATVIAAVADKETPWGALGNFVRFALHMPLESEQPRIADHLLIVFVFTALCYFLFRLYETWDGAISVSDHTKQRYREPRNLLLDGSAEAARVLMRKPALEKYSAATRPLESPLPSPQDTLAWHVQAYELLCLRSKRYEFDADHGWHDQAHCWIGSNRNTRNLVAMRCANSDLSKSDLESFVHYVERVATQRGQSMLDAELIMAIRESRAAHTTQVGHHLIKCETEETLLTDLVDFSDYYMALRRRVEREPLADSALTLAQVYVPPHCRDESGASRIKFEEYLDAWLVEPGQRQLALLGEYGQGKSTAALYSAYRLSNQSSRPRIPILLDLRGKSPRNETPEDLIAGWAFPFGVNPQAVMKLLIAGRAFLILEGFDEMALVGDSETRVAHFQALWKFCYPAAKLLITGRPNFFLDDREMRVALAISKTDAAGPYCEALHLEPFTIDQIDTALRASPVHTRSEIVALAQRDAKFYEIVSRGSLLYVVSQLWEREQLSTHAEQLTSAFIMDLFIRHSLRRQGEKASAVAPQFMILNEGERAFFMSGVAAYMGAHVLPNQIGRTDFDKAIKALYEAIPEGASSVKSGLEQRTLRPLRERLKDAGDPIEEASNDIRACGLLVVDHSTLGALRFAHKSFMEYLMAAAFADFVLRENRERANALVSASGLGARHILRSPEATAFFAEIVGAAADSKHTPASKRLFDMIVSGQGRSRILGRAVSAFAVQALIASAAPYGYAQSPRWLNVLRSALSLRFVTLAMFTTSLLFLQMEVMKVAESGALGGLGPSWLWSPLAGYSGFMLIIMALSGSAYMVGGSGASGLVRLWFTSCVFLGMSESDIGKITGTRWVLPIARFLEIDGRIST